MANPRRAAATPGRVRALAGESEGASGPSLKRLGGHVGAPHDER